MFMRPNSKSGCQFRDEIGAAQISTVTLVFDDTMPFGRSRYAEIVESGFAPVVVPGRTTRVPSSVAPFPRTWSGTDAIASVKTVPLVAAPAVWLKDQRFTRAACAEAVRAMSAIRRRVFI